VQIIYQHQIVYDNAVVEIRQSQMSREYTTAHEPNKKEMVIKTRP